MQRKENLELSSRNFWRPGNLKKRSFQNYLSSKKYSSLLFYNFLNFYYLRKNFIPLKNLKFTNDKNS